MPWNPIKTGDFTKRCFGLRGDHHFTKWRVIGVGLFTVGANAGANCPWVLMATVAALAISIYPALLYAEMGAMFPLRAWTHHAPWPQPPQGNAGG